MCFTVFLSIVFLVEVFSFFEVFPKNTTNINDF